MFERINYRDGGGLPDDRQTIRGAKLADVEQLRATLLRKLYANNCLRPYFKFGDLPIPFVEGQAASILCIGDSGSAKTTTLRSLMSYVMPLPRRRVENILECAAHQRKPSSPQEFSRSLTFQAVVYNAKTENVPFLVGLGFDPSTDLIIMDPADERSFAWDIAKDVNSIEDIDHLLNLLIPTRAESHREDKKADFFEANARKLIRDIVVSLRNAALARGLQPAWTLHNLMKPIAVPDYLRYVLQWHDTPDEAAARIDVVPETWDGIVTTARTFLDPFEQAAERWDEAARLGRKISFKDWALRGGNTVLVLPNTESNVLVNGPLNRLMLRALTDLIITHEYSFIRDQSGRRRVRKRYFFFDELGYAGNLPMLKRLLTEGREFGVNAVLGLHAISQLEHTYGKEDANTILSLCPYKALLRAGDSVTAKWMAECVGDCLRAYRKLTITTGNTSSNTWGTQQSNTVGSSDGKTITDGKSTSSAISDSEADTRTNQIGRNGESRLASTSKQKNRGSSTTDSQSESVAQSHQDSESQTSGASQGGSSSTSASRNESVDLRQETALYTSEFMNFPDPAETRIVRMVARVPFLGPWQVDMSLDLMIKQLEKPVETVPAFQRWKDDDRVSRAKAWTTDDFGRLGIAPQAPRTALGSKTTAAPIALAHTEREECDDEGGLPTPKFDF